MTSVQMPCSPEDAVARGKRVRYRVSESRRLAAFAADAGMALDLETAENRAEHCYPQQQHICEATRLATPKSATPPPNQASETR
jgi:hypothetical protein